MTDVVPSHAPGSGPREDGERFSYRADLALLPGGWAREVLLEVGRDGSLLRVEPDSADGEGEPTGGVTVPGVPNLHSHAFQRAMAGLAETPGGSDDTFWSWRETLYAFLQRLSPEDVEAVTAFVYMEMLLAGYTSVVEFHYLHLDPAGRPYQDPAELSRRVLAGAERAGIGLTHLPALYRSGGFGGAPPGPGQCRFLRTPDELLELVARVRDEAVEDRRIRSGLALHSLRAVPLDALQEVLEGYESLDPEGPIHIHVSEQRREVEACLEWCGLRPVELLLDRAPVDGRWCLVHATHALGQELAQVASRGAVVGLCPTTEANLGDGIFPLEAYAAAGGRWGVGSDSHVSISPVEELRWLEYAQRLLREERNVLGRALNDSTGTALFLSALSGGAQATGRPVGALEPGRQADLVVLDPELPDLRTRSPEKLLDTWIFSGNRNAVRHVMVGGRWIVRDGRHERGEEIARGYRRAISRILDTG